MKATFKGFRLSLLFWGLAAVSATAADRTWTGGGADSSWTNAANWGGTAPVAGDALRFTGALNLAATNDFPTNTSFAGVTFLPAATGFSLAGSGITLGGDLVNQSPAAQTIGLPLLITAARSVDTANGAVVFTKALAYQVSTATTLRKSGTNEWVFTGDTVITNQYSQLNLEQGALRFASGSRFHLVDTRTGDASRNYIIVAGLANKKTALTVEPNAEVVLGGIMVQPNAVAGNTFDVLVNGGTLNCAGYESTFGDQPGNLIRCVVTNNGTWKTGTNSWISAGTRSQMAIELNGGTIWLDKFGMGRQDSQGDRPGRVDVAINQGLFYVNKSFGWMSSTSISRTNTVTLGNGVTNLATLSSPAMGQASASGTTILNLNGGLLECRTASDNFLSGLDQVNLLKGGVTIDTLSNNVTITESILRDPALSLATRDGGLTKRGTASLTFSGPTNQFNGPLRVEGGSLRIASAMLADLAEITLAPGATLSFRGTNRQALAPARLILGDASTASRLDFDAAADGSACDTLRIPAGGYIGKMNIYLCQRAGTEIALSLPGDYPIFTYETEPPDLALLTHANREFGVTSSFVVDRAAKSVILRLAASATESTWANAAGGAWETAANWTPASPAGTPASRARFWGAISAPATVTLGTDTAIGGFSFNNAQSYTLTGSGVLTLGDQNGGGYLTCDAGSHTVNLALNLPYPTTVNVPASQTLTLNGPVAGSGGIIKGNPGTLLLTNANTFAGGVTVNAGTLDIPAAAALGTGPLALAGGTARSTGASLTLASSLRVQAGGVLDCGANAVRLDGLLDWTGSGTFVKHGTGELTLAGTCSENSTNMLFNFRQGTTRLVSGAAYSLRGANRDVLQTAYSAAGQTSSLIIEPGAALAAGGMRLMTGGWAGTSTVHVAGGRLNLLDTEATVVNSGGGRGDILVSNGGALYAATGFFSLGVNGLGTLTVTNGSASLARLTLAGYADSLGTGNRGGTAAVTVSSNGTLEVREYLTWITDNKGLTAWLRLDGGRLIIPATARCAGSTGTARLILDGGTLECSGLASYASAAAPATTLSDYLYGVNELQLGARGVTIDTRLNDLTFTQPLAMEAGTASAAGFTKAGAGSLTLAGANTFDAPVTVNAGTLVLPALPANSLTVAAGARLVPSAGSVRTESLTAASFATGASLALDLAAAGSSDRLAVSGALALGSRVDLALNGAQAGTYTLFTYGSLAGSPAALRVANPVAGLAYAFADTGSAITLTVTAAPADARWANDADGAWHTAANWNPQSVPDGAGHAARFDLAFAAPRTVTVDGDATLGALLFNSATAPSLAGSGTLTLNASGAPALIEADQGAPVIGPALTLAADTSVRLAPGATLTLAGNVSGGGALSATGGTLILAGTNTAAQTFVSGGTLALGGAAAQQAPLTLDNATLATAAAATLSTGITANVLGATVVPAAGTTLNLSGTLDGPGGFTKTGSSTLTLSGTLAYRGTTAVNGGTLALAAPPPAALALGAGTLAYAGADANLPGYTLNTASNGLAAVLRAAANLTVTGAVQSVSGSFVKTGAGTLSFTYPGAQTLGLANGNAAQDALLNIGANGDAPTQGFNPFSVSEGTVTLGAPGQVNTFAANLVVGHYTTAAAGAETAAHLVITGGTTLVGGNISVGRGNGNAVTAPTPLRSSVTISGGTASAASFSLGHNGGNTVGFNAQPTVTVNAGDVTAGQINLGEHLGSAATFTVNGGTVTVTDLIRVGHQTSSGGGGTGTLAVNGGTLTVANDINLGVTASATGTLQLAGGLVAAHNVTVGSGSGRILFDGGTLRLSNGPLANLQTLVMDGGARIEVPSGRFTFATALLAGEAACGGLTKAGAGMLALDNSAPSTYTGATTVAEGTLALRGTAASLPAATSLTVLPGAGFHASSEQVAAPRTVALAGLTLGSAELSASAANLALWLNAGNQSDCFDVSGTTLLGKAAVALYQAGTLSPALFNGTYAIVRYSGAAPDVSGLTVVNPNPARTYTFSVNDASKQVLLTVADNGSAAADAVWTRDGDGAWSAGSNWQSGSAPTAIAAPALFPGVLTQDRTVTVDAPAAVGGLTFDATNRYTLSGAATLTLNSGGTPAALTLARGSHTLAAPLAIAASGSVTVAPSNNTLTIAGPVSGAGAALALTSSGTLQLSNSTCEAAVTVAAGTLELAAGTQLNGGLRYSAGQISGTGNATVGGTVELPPGSKSVAVAANATLAVTGPVTGQGTLVKDSAGTLELASANNSYSGATRVKAGIFALRGSGTPGPGPVTFEGGALGSSGSSAVAFANPLGFTNNTTVYADAPLATAGAMSMPAPRSLTKEGTNVWSIGGLFAQPPNDAYLFFLRNGTVRFDAGSSFTLDSAAGSGLRNQFDASFSVSNRVMGLTVETNASVTLGSLGVQFGSVTPGRFDLTMNGGRLALTGANPLGLGDSSNAFITVTVNGGELVTTNDAAWCDIGTRCPVAWTQNGGRVSLGRPAFGRQNASGTGRLYGSVNLAINGGTFEARQFLSWKSTDDSRTTNTVTLGNGTPFQGTFSVPATRRYHDGGRVILNLNGGILEARGLTSSDASLNGSLSDYLSGVNEIDVGIGGAVIDTLTNAIAIRQSLTPLPADGGLVKLGAGSLALSNDVALAGPVTLSNGTLRAHFTQTNNLFLAGGSLFDAARSTALGQPARFGNVSGSGTLTNGTLAVTGTLSPGVFDGQAGTLTAEGLTLAAGSRLRFDWSPSTNDLFAVRSLLSVEGPGTIDFGRDLGDEIPVPFSAVLGTYAGSFSGSFGGWRSANTGLRAQAALATTVTAQNGVVRINITYGGLLILVR